MFVSRTVKQQGTRQHGQKIQRLCAQCKMANGTYHFLLLLHLKNREKEWKEGKRKKEGREGEKEAGERRREFRKKRIKERKNRKKRRSE